MNPGAVFPVVAQVFDGERTLGSVTTKIVVQAQQNPALELHFNLTDVNHYKGLVSEHRYHYSISVKLARESRVHFPVQHIISHFT